MKNLIFVLLMPVLVIGCRSIPMQSSKTDVYALRLQPGQDLKKELDQFAKSRKIEAGFIVTCVGSLRKANLRLANQPQPTAWERKFEIVSLVGTLSPDGSHLHIAIADSTGATLGGHLLEGNEIYTTAEIVIGSAQSLRFRRETDPQTTYKELKVD